MSESKQQQIVVVVGGASGIGLATAKRYAADGARVVIGDLNGESAQQRAAEIGDGAWGQQVDVVDESSVQALFDSVIEKEGRFDVVASCAGLGTFAPITELELSEWNRIVDVCLNGAFLVMKHAGRRIADGGSIVTIASLNAIQPAAGMSAYCAAKAGVSMLTKVGAMEMGARGIRVNAVAPGLVETPLVDGLVSVPEIVRQFHENAPLGRAGQPEEIADAIHFLSTPGGWISGETLVVDGGGHTGRYPRLMDIMAPPSS